MRNGPLQSNGVVKPDPGSHQKGGLEREKAGMSEWKEAAYRPNGALSPNPRSRREKGVWNMRDGPLQSNGVVKSEKAGTNEWKEAGL